VLEISKLMDSTNPDCRSFRGTGKLLLKDNAHDFAKSGNNTIAYYKPWSPGWARIPSIASCGSTSTQVRRTPAAGERHRRLGDSARVIPGRARRLGDQGRARGH